MNEASARLVLLIKSIEEADVHGQLLTREERQSATQTAFASGHEQPAFLIRRMLRLRELLERRRPALRTILNAPSKHRAIVWVLAIASFMIGVAINELGETQRISVLAAPLLGVFAWNIAVYLALLVAFVAALLTAPRHARQATAPSRIARYIVALSLRADETRGSARIAPSSDIQPIVADAMRRFQDDWSAFIAPLYTAQARALLHTCAALMVTGAVAGMYLRGLAFEYRAGWESTFLNAQTVHTLLSWLLGPASFITGIPIGSTEHLQTIRWSDTQPGENAAHWIHLYAVTAAIVVIIPRLLLAAWALLGAHRRLRTSSSDRFGAYAHRLLVEVGRAAPASVVVLPFSYGLPEAAPAALKPFLTSYLDEPIELSLRSPIAYGDEDSYGEPIEGPVAIVVNIASTPENETHGELIDRIRQISSPYSAPRSRLLLVVDSARYRHFGARLEERSQAWQAFAQAHDIEAVVLDLSHAPSVEA